MYRHRTALAVDGKGDGNRPDDNRGGAGPQGGPGIPPLGPHGPSRTSWLYILVVCALAVYIAMTFAPRTGGQQTVELATSEFVTAVREDRVDTATYVAVSGAVEGTFWQSESDKGDEARAVRFESTYVGSDSLSELMAEHPETTFKVDTSDPNFIANILMAVLPTVLLVFVMVYFMRQMTGANNKAMQFGKTNAKTSEAMRPKVKFKDVAGIDEAVEELVEVRDFLAEPEKFRRLGAKIPRGVLLVVPHGTGKTLLA